MKRGITVFILVFLLTILQLGINLPAQAASFTDVPSRAADEVNYLADGEIAKGSSKTSFNPHQAITRAEAVTLIGRALQLNGAQRKTVFSDVGTGNYASGFIQSSVDKKNITNSLSGVSTGRFYPNKDVTRGEMAIMIANAFGYSYGGTTSGAAKALMDRGVASGTGGGTFGMNLTIKRADFAVFLARAINPAFRTKQSTSFSKTFWTDVENLNIRTGPSTSFVSKGKIAKNVKVLGAHSVGGWTYIKTGSTVGFVSTYYLRNSATGDGGNISAPPARADSRLSGQTIILDPGHGGKDPGSVGFGLREKDVVLSTSLKVNNLLKKTPFNVKMTRSSDTFVSINARPDFAIKNKGNVFVSIHANAASASATGTETFYYSAGTNPYVSDSKLLATKIQTRMIAAWNLRDRGVKSGNYGVLRENNMPATLAELGFITNKSDNDKLKSDYWQTVAAKAIYLGILDYYKAKGFNVETLYKVAS
ncbi:N-acetylmuramoyl-L-alanine amidase [Domibacillus robiginosus]|uniref:N-acetylmuramoyl-L-alanine amidase n=1 Tax=Domibacillus robiginosus TaxID=1071054 RepID=UPI00067D1DCC|nr:N-acetylmuramoyl-L-alanine amidase [Domibacillus robiginosus]